MRATLQIDGGEVRSTRDDRWLGCKGHQGTRIGEEEQLRDGRAVEPLSVHSDDLCHICETAFHWQGDSIGNFAVFGRTAWNNRVTALEAFALIATFKKS